MGRSKIDCMDHHTQSTVGAITYTCCILYMCKCQKNRYSTFYTVKIADIELKLIGPPNFSIQMSTGHCNTIIYAIVLTLLILMLSH